jgi:photosystem II stability/assembly factor-like uncharacterized protein
MRQMPPAIPEAGEGVMRDAANGGRVQSIAVNPTDRRNAIIAMQFGGMWKTYNSGDAWFRVYSLPAVHVTDVEYGADGKTVIATVYRDNRTQPGGGGGIYVSRSNGDFWSRPATGIVPMPSPNAAPTSAYSVSRAPDERGLWYAGSDFGVGISSDDGATWTHKKLGASAVQSVLAFPGGSVLAMDSSSVWRSDDRGTTWRVIITDDFTHSAPISNGLGNSGNKMDRSPLHPWAFIFRSYTTAPANGSGKLWFYELDTDIMTPLALPQGRSRGPFARVSKDDLFGGNHIRVWIGAGWDGYYVIREDAASIRALLSTPEWDDWVSFIAEAGIHADMGDLGLDGDAKPALMGTDGGIYRPRPMPKWWDIGGQSKWMSAAKPGSGMNSLQISDLAGTNVHGSNSVTTSLYFTTQDNHLYTSADGGSTWKVGDAGEGFGLEARHDTNSGEPAHIAFVGVVNGGDKFADLNMQNKRITPRVDENNQPLADLQNPFFVSQTGSNSSNWVRRRAPANMPLIEVYFSNNSGDNWRKFATVNFKQAGEVRTVGTVAWVPVKLGGLLNRIGLVPISTSTPPGVPAPTYDDSDVVALPGGAGSLGQRFTEFDKHAIYAVNPLNWAHLIAPDIGANDMKVTRDGGKTWFTMQGLTAQVLRGGALRMYGGRADLMNVTEIAFDPYNAGRILVGTRDAGIICSANDGRTWRTIYDSDKVQYITGFHFHPNGTVYVSAYGHGLWRIKATRGCPKSYKFPWDFPRDVDLSATETGVLARNAPPPTPRGLALPDRPKLFLQMKEDSSRRSEYLAVAGRGFPASQSITLRVREMQTLVATFRADATGKFAGRLPLPESLPYGDFIVEARGAAGLLTTDEFSKPHSDDELLERASEGGPKNTIPPRRR